MNDDPDALAVITARLTSRVWEYQAAGRADSAQLVHDLIHDLTGATECPVCHQPHTQQPRGAPMTEQPTIPGEHETEPDLDIEQDNPDLELPDDDEEIELEPVTEDDLPEVDPHGDDEPVLDDDEEN